MVAPPLQRQLSQRVDAAPSPLPPCTWSAALPNKYIQNCASLPPGPKCRNFTTLSQAISDCDADLGCGGVTSQGAGAAPWETRAGPAALDSPNGEVSYAITNLDECHPPAPVVPDAVWKARGAAAYAGVARTDPEAVWSFQGWAIIYWTREDQASAFRGFVDAVPPGKFVVVDMSEDGCGGWYTPPPHRRAAAPFPYTCKGEWSKFGDASFFGAPFLWTALHDFGGTDGLKGALGRAAELPFAGLASAGGANTSVFGSGFTPEGIDQNPVFYELLLSNAFRAAPEANVTDWAISRAHRRYNLSHPSADVTEAWSLLAGANYAGFGTGVWDATGVPHIPATATQFEGNRRTPAPALCATWGAWGALLSAASAAAVPPGVLSEPLCYDLVNTGREVLAQVAAPVSMNFSDAVGANLLDGAMLSVTGQAYLDLLADVDELAATDEAFLLGPWLAAARGLAAAGDDEDCAISSPADPLPCADFYEWNARAQLTTWKPCLEEACLVSKDRYTPTDYAAKHWSGLISGYYRPRVEQMLLQALEDAAGGRPLDRGAVDVRWSKLAFDFQRDFGNMGPLAPVGDAIEVSARMRAKYGAWFAGCGGTD